MKRYVKFVRLNVTKADDVSTHLTVLYNQGWRVISHTETDGEYSFVLERD